MFEFFRELFSSDGFMPHGHCYLWRPELVWLHVVSDTFIGLAYVTISLTLASLVRRIKLPFSPMFLAFGLFIGACGLTHFWSVWNVWEPAYWSAGVVKAITALASVATALLLFPVRPKAVALAESARLAEQRRLQLETAHRELEALYERVKELDRLKTQFFANVSHELRTPLALILGPVDHLLSEPDLDERHLQQLRVVRRNARSLLGHVNDLLDVSKIEAGRMESEYARVDLARLTRLVASRFESLAADSRISFVLEAPETLHAAVDPRQIERVLVNLLSNAFKFTPEQGAVRVRLGAAGDRALLSVEDSGPGVPADQRQIIFERFRQADEGVARRFDGTGLGLAIVKDFVELHGGTVQVGDAPGGGALFTVELPLLAPPGREVRDEAELDRPAEEGEDEARAEPAPREEVEAPPAGDPRRPLVLVVEDNAEMRSFVRDVLAADFRVATAGDGAEGLDRARALRPDLTVTDIMMPRVSGDAMVEAVRRRPELEAMPILLLSARADEELRVRLLREGAQDYLTKPFAAEELRVRARNLVTIHRLRRVLQEELETQAEDLEALAWELAQRRRELVVALDAARDAQMQAVKASEVKSVFLRLVSHELRTPLTSLTLQLDVLRRDKDRALTERQRRAVDRMASAVDRLLHLIEAVLEYSRIESGQLRARVEHFDLRALTSETMEQLRPEAVRKLLSLSLEATSELPPLYSDPSLVRMILVNLVGNAIKFTSLGGVTVSLAHGPEGHGIEVRDTGPGILPEDQDRIFEPFEQLDPVEKKHKAGVGLGLALVKAMVDALGGRVVLASTVGVGSAFTVVLPPLDEELTDVGHRQS